MQPRRWPPLPTASSSCSSAWWPSARTTPGTRGSPCGLASSAPCLGSLEWFYSRRSSTKPGSRRYHSKSSLSWLTEASGEPWGSLWSRFCRTRIRSKICFWPPRSSWYLSPFSFKEELSSFWWKNWKFRRKEIRLLSWYLALQNVMKANRPWHKKVLKICTFSKYFKIYSIPYSCVTLQFRRVRRNFHRNFDFSIFHRNFEFNFTTINENFGRISIKFTNLTNWCYWIIVDAMKFSSISAKFFIEILTSILHY